MTDLRDRIARALHRQVVVEAQSHRIDIEVHSEGIAFERRLADAVLAVLADLPDDVIEQAAIELFRDSWAGRPSAAKARMRWNWLHDEEQQYWRSKVGLVVAAAFGGEPS